MKKKLSLFGFVALTVPFISSADIISTKQVIYHATGEMFTPASLGVIVILGIIIIVLFIKLIKKRK